MITRRYLIDALVISALTIVLLYIADFKVWLKYDWDAPPPLRGNALALSLPAMLIFSWTGPVWRWIHWAPWPFMEYGPIFVLSVVQWLWVRRWWNHLKSHARLHVFEIVLSMVIAIVVGVWAAGSCYYDVVQIQDGWKYFRRLPDATAFVLIWLPQIIGIWGKFGWGVFLLGTVVVEIARTALASWTSAVRLWRSIAISLLATAILGWRVDLTSPMLSTLAFWLLVGGILFLVKKRSDSTVA